MGFDPFESSRIPGQEFSVKLYLVGTCILFMIFDLEISFLYFFFLGVWFIIKLHHLDFELL